MAVLGLAQALSPQQTEAQSPPPELLTVPSQLKIGDPPVTVQVRAGAPTTGDPPVPSSVTISSNSGPDGVYIALQSGCGGAGAGSVTVMHNDVVHLVGCNVGTATLTVSEVGGQTVSYQISIVEPDPTQVCRPNITGVSSSTDSITISKSAWPPETECITPDEYLVIYQTESDTKVPVLQSAPDVNTNTIGYQNSSDAQLTPDGSNIFLRPGSEYTFYLQGFAQGVAGSISVGRTIRTAGVPISGGGAPSSPSLDPPTFVGYDTNVAPGQVRILWRPPMSGQPRNYILQFEDNGRYITPLGGNSITPGASDCVHLTSGESDCTVFTIEGFVPGATVEVGVAAAYGPGAISRFVTIDARAGVDSATPRANLDPPTFLGYDPNAAAGQIRILWRPPATGAPTGYILQYYAEDVGDFIPPAGGNNITPGSVSCVHLTTGQSDCTAFTTGGFTEGESVRVGVAAIYGPGMVSSFEFIDALAGVQSGVPTDILEPPRFLGFDPDAAAGEIRILWRPPATRMPLHYILQYYAEEQGDFIPASGGDNITPGSVTCIHLASREGDCTAFTTGGFINGETVRVGVAAVYGPGSISNLVILDALAGVEGTPPTETLEPPRFVGSDSNVASGQIRVLWRPPETRTPLNYVLQYFAEEEGDFITPSGGDPIARGPGVNCVHLTTGDTDCTVFTTGGFLPGETVRVVVAASYGTDMLSRFIGIEVIAGVGGTPPTNLEPPRFLGGDPDVGPGEIRVLWRPPATETPIHYILQYYDEGQGDFTTPAGGDRIARGSVSCIHLTSGESDCTDFRTGGFLPGETVSVVVAASYGPHGTSPFVGVEVVAGRDDTLPEDILGPPQEWGYVSEGLPEGQVLLFWRPPAIGTATGYTLQIQRSNANRWSHPVNAAIPGETGYAVAPRSVRCEYRSVGAQRDCTDFPISGLLAGGEYSARVQAWSFQRQMVSEWREWEFIASSGPDPDLPMDMRLDPPFELITLTPDSPEQRTLVLQWKRVPDASRYRAEYTTDPAGIGGWRSYPGGEAVGNTAVSCRVEKNVSAGNDCIHSTVRGINPNSLYFFRVQSQTDTLESDWAYYLHDPLGLDGAPDTQLPLPKPHGFYQVGAAETNVTMQWRWTEESSDTVFQLQYQGYWPDVQTRDWFNAPEWRDTPGYEIPNVTTSCKVPLSVPFDPDNPPSEDGTVTTAFGDARCIEFRIRGLDSGTTYPVRVRAVRGPQESSWTSGTRARTTGQASVPPTEPPRLQGLTQTGAGDGTITLQWRPPESLSALYYSLTYEAYYEEGGHTVEIPPPGGSRISPGMEACDAGIDGTHVNSGQEDCTEFLITGLERSQRYPVSVVTVTSLGASDPDTIIAVSGGADGQITPGGTLLSPRNLTLYDEPGTTTLDVIWLDPGNGVAEHYDVQVMPFWPENSGDGPLTFPDGHIGDDTVRSGSEVPRWVPTSDMDDHGPCVSRVGQAGSIRPDTEPDNVHCTRFVITGLEFSTRYLVRVRTARGMQRSDPPLDRIFRTANAAGGVDRKVPPPRNLLTLEATNSTSIALQWDNPPGIDQARLFYYSLQYRPPGGSFRTIDHIPPSPDGPCFRPFIRATPHPTPVRSSDNARPTCTTYTITNLVRGTSYDVKIWAFYRVPGVGAESSDALVGIAWTTGEAATTTTDDPAETTVQVTLYPSPINEIRENEYMPVQVAIENGDMEEVRILIRPANQKNIQIARGDTPTDLLDSMQECRTRHLADPSYYGQDQQMYEEVDLDGPGDGTDTGQWFCLHAIEVTDGMDSATLIVQYEGKTVESHDIVILKANEQISQWFIVYPLKTIFVRGQTYPVQFEFTEDWDTALDSKIDLFFMSTVGDAVSNTIESKVSISHLGDAASCNDVEDTEYRQRATLDRTSNQKETFCLSFGETELEDGEIIALHASVLQPFDAPDPTDPAYIYEKVYSPIQMQLPVGGSGPASSTSPEPDVDECDHENDILCLQPWVAQVCAWMGMSCNSKLLFQIMIMVVSAFIASIPLFVAWSTNGTLTPPHVGFSFVLLLCCMVLGYRIFGLPTYQAILPILPVILIAAIYFARRVHREAT